MNIRLNGKYYINGGWLLWKLYFINDDTSELIDFNGLPVYDENGNTYNFEVTIGYYYEYNHQTKVFQRIVTVDECDNYIYKEIPDEYVDKFPINMEYLNNIEIDAVNPIDGEYYNYNHTIVYDIYIGSMSLSSTEENFNKYD